MNHECKYENIVREMSGDIRQLLAEFKSLNSSVQNIKKDQIYHERDAIGYRRKIDRIWTGIHIAKWLILITIGSGLFWRFMQWR